MRATPRSPVRGSSEASRRQYLTGFVMEGLTDRTRLFLESTRVTHCPAKTARTAINLETPFIIVAAADFFTTLAWGPFHIPHAPAFAPEFSVSYGTAGRCAGQAAFDAFPPAGPCGRRRFRGHGARVTIDHAQRR